MEDSMAEKPNPALTKSEVQAAQVRKVLREAAKRIPGLKAPHKALARTLTAHRTVPRKFLLGIVFAVETSERLRAISKFDVEDARDAMEFQAAFRPVADQLALMLASLNHTIDLRMAPVAAGALQTYTIAKVLARSRGNSDLTQNLDALKRDLGRRRTKKRKTTKAKKVASTSEKPE
jgi:hypothetical protein